MIFLLSLQLHVQKISSDTCNLYASTRQIISATYAADSVNFGHENYDSYCPQYRAALFKEAPAVVQNLVISTDVSLEEKTNF